MFFEKECQVLDLPLFSSQELVRKRYLELVRQYPPEQYPEKSAIIRDAYEKLYNIKDHLELVAETSTSDDDISQIIQELEQDVESPRIPVETLLSFR